jgi:hypothetical protein
MEWTPPPHIKIFDEITEGDIDITAGVYRCVDFGSEQTDESADFPLIEININVVRSHDRHRRQQ